MAPAAIRRLGWATPILAALAVAVLLPLATFLVGVWLFGGQLQAVLSGSMAPAYPQGSLIVMAPIDASAVEVGMPVSFIDPADGGRVVTHRVTAVVAGPSLQFVTQGDANARPDPIPVPARSIRGRVLWSVTGLGTVVAWLQWPRGFLLLVVVPLALLLVVEWRARADRRQIPG
jgi:signal peptidase